MLLEALGRARRIGMLRKYRWAVVIIITGTLWISGLSAIEPLFLKYFFDGLGPGGDMKRLLRWVGLIALAGVLREWLAARTNYRTWRVRLSVHEDLLNLMVGRLHKLPLSFYRSEGVGAIMTRLERGVNGVIETITQLFFNVLPAVVFLVISIVIMFRLEWRLALVILVLAPLPPLIAVKAAPYQIERERTLLDRWMRIYSRFNEVLSGIMTVRSFTREHDEKNRFVRDVSDANRIVVSGVGFDVAVGASQNLVIMIARVAALLIGGSLALSGRITAGTLVAFLGYVGSVFAPVQGLTSIYRTMQTGKVALESVMAIVDTQETLGDAPDARELTTVRGDVTFDNVHFSYGDRPILRGVSLDVYAGEMIALVGPSGGGKSTLMALLQRFYDPTEGRILVDGIDIRTVKQQSLRTHIGVVLQEALLFDGTVADNIAYGKPDATIEEIEAAAKAAHADEFIRQLPGGYGAMVGERGSRLSVGERQRIAIARALLRNPPILILDEATSALDAESEAIVQDALERLIRGRTTFVIAHRLSTVVHADRVCVLRDGRITEAGPHVELMRAGGYYASLVERQTRGLLPREVEAA
jgi:ATP-binding cassette subfamily B protein